jgi:hypothetical protein
MVGAIEADMNSARAEAFVHFRMGCTPSTAWPILSVPAYATVSPAGDAAAGDHLVKPRMFIARKPRLAMIMA